MGKYWKLLWLCGLVAVLSVPVIAADVTTDSSGPADIHLTLEQFCEISFDDDASFAINLSGGASSGEDSEGIDLGANFAWKVTAVLTKPTDAPGTWSYYFDTEGTTQLTGAAGTHTGHIVFVKVTGVSLGDGNGSWTTGGDLTITIQEQP